MINFELSEELAMVKRTARELATERIRPCARDAEAAGAVPADLADEYVGLGLNAVDVPEAAGGLGLGLVARVVIDESIAYGDPGIALGLPNTGAFGRFVLALATEAQQARLLSALIESSRAGAICFTDARPKPGRFTTKAQQQADGGWRISGIKTEVIGAAAAASFLVFADAISSDGKHAPAAFVVGASSDGIRIDPPFATLGLCAAPPSTVTFEHVAVADDDRLSGADDDFDRAVIGAFAEAGVIGAARAVGLADAAFELARDWAAERRAFGKPIAHFQGLAFLLADMATTVEVMRCVVQRAAWALDTGQGDALALAAGAIAECHEGAMFVADNGVQVLGGSGFIRDFLAEKWMRDAKAHMAYALGHQTCDLLLGRLSLEGDRLALTEDAPMADVQSVMI